MSSSLLGGKDVKKTGELLGVNLVSLNEKVTYFNVRPLISLTFSFHRSNIRQLPKALIFSVDEVDLRVYRNSETQHFQISAEGRVNLWAKLIRSQQKNSGFQNMNSLWFWQIQM